MDGSDVTLLSFSVTHISSVLSGPKGSQLILKSRCWGVDVKVFGLYQIFDLKENFETLFEKPSFWT